MTNNSWLRFLGLIFLKRAGRYICLPGVSCTGWNHVLYGRSKSLSNRRKHGAAPRFPWL